MNDHQSNEHGQILYVQTPYFYTFPSYLGSDLSLLQIIKKPQQLHQDYGCNQISSDTTILFEFDS